MTKYFDEDGRATDTGLDFGYKQLASPSGHKAYPYSLVNVIELYKWENRYWVDVIVESELEDEERFTKWEDAQAFFDKRAKELGYQLVIQG